MIKANQLLCIIHCAPLGLIFLYVIRSGKCEGKINKVNTKTEKVFKEAKGSWWQRVGTIEGRSATNSLLLL